MPNTSLSSHLEASLIADRLNHFSAVKAQELKSFVSYKKRDWCQSLGPLILYETKLLIHWNNTVSFCKIYLSYLSFYFSEFEIIGKISPLNLIAYNFAIKTAHQSALQTEEWLKMRDKCLAICKTNWSTKLESPCFALPTSPSFACCIHTTPKMHFSFPHFSHIM